MLIVADENIPFAETLFSRLGTVRTMPGRQMMLDAVRNADLLMVRSVTRVNENLLSGTHVRFVGTATAGTDHVDEAWLNSQDIGFVSAPGCNAESVAQYVAAALAWASVQSGRPLSGSSIGIIGVGQCGSRVERIAHALGMEVRLNDPPLARRTMNPRYRPLEDLLDCDYLTFHVPLTREGADPTVHLLDAVAMEKMKRDAIVINASRGGVVDEAALLERLGAGRLGGAIIDAWVDEPLISYDLLRWVMLGTPHIAGYSYDGKVAGSRMIYEAACQYMEVPIQKVELPMPPVAVPQIVLDAANRGLDSVLAELILTAYPIWRDSGDLLFSASTEPEKMGTAFDRRRKFYPLRREFGATQVSLKGAPLDWIERIKTIGFNVTR